MFGMSRIPPTSSLLPCRGLHDDIFGRLTRERSRRRTICRLMPEGEAETSFLHRGGSVFQVCFCLLVQLQVGTWSTSCLVSPTSTWTGG